MKKILLIAFSVLATTTLVQAQTRTIDWSVDQILRPDTLFSNSTTGTAVSLTFVCKNLGKDTLFATDTLLYQFAVTNIANTQTILLYPGPNTSTLSARLVGKTVLPNDTIHVSINLNTNLVLSFSAPVNFSVISHVINRPNLNFETSQTNNIKTKAIVWMNAQKWGVGFDQINANKLVSVYPNPCANEINFEVGNLENSTVKIFDMMGKLMDTIELNSSINPVDLTNYSNGMYFYQITNSTSNTVESGKFKVSK